MARPRPPAARQNPPADPENAGRPACFADGSTVNPGAPKGIRNLTWGFQPEPAHLAESRKVAGRAACAVPVDSSASRPVTGCVSAFLTHKAREWHALTL